MRWEKLYNIKSQIDGQINLIYFQGTKNCVIKFDICTIKLVWSNLCHTKLALSL